MVVLASALGAAPSLPFLAITTFLVLILVVFFGFIGDLLGGSSFNPTLTATFYAIGLGGSDSFVSATLHLPTQLGQELPGCIPLAPGKTKRKQEKVVYLKGDLASQFITGH